LVLIKPEHDQWDPGEHNGTFRSNNLAFVGAATALELWREEGFCHALCFIGERLERWTTELTATLGSQFLTPKGIGPMSGLGFTDSALACQVAREAFNLGVLVETSGPNQEVLKLMPPLTIEPDILEEGLHRLEACIYEALFRH